MSIEFVELGEIATLQAGIGFPLNLQGRKTGQYPFAKVGDISRCGRTGNSILTTADHYVEKSDISALRAKVVPVGSILFAKIGEAIRHNHRVIAGCEMLVDNNAMAVIPGKKIDGRFLFHFLKTVDFYCLAPATTVPALRKSDLERIPTPLPSLAEQRRIAAILDQADLLRTKRREALAQLDSLTQSIFSNIFAGALSNNARLELSHYIEEFRYGTSNKSGIGGYPALRIPNVASGSLDLKELKTVAVTDAEFSRLKLSEGDLLFVRTNGNPDNVGRCAVFKSAIVADSGFDSAQFIYASYLIRARMKRNTVLPIVLQQYLSFGEGRQALRARSKTSAGQFNINTEGLGTLPIPSFPMPLQEAFIFQKQVIEKQQAIQRSCLAELEALFSTLQHRAFRGEL